MTKKKSKIKNVGGNFWYLMHGGLTVIELRDEIKKIETMFNMRIELIMRSVWLWSVFHRSSPPENRNRNEMSLLANTSANPSATESPVRLKYREKQILFYFILASHFYYQVKRALKNSIFPQIKMYIISEIHQLRSL